MALATIFIRKKVEKRLFVIQNVILKRERERERWGFEQKTGRKEQAKRVTSILFFIIML